MSEGRKLGVRGGTLGSKEVVGTPKIGPTGGRDPKTYSLISITPYLNLTPPHSPSPPEPPWDPKNFLGPQEALGAFGSLQQPWVFSETQRPCFPCSPSPPLTSSCSLLPLLPLSLPGFPWAPGTFLGPQKALGAFASLWQPWVFSQTQRPCFPCSLTPLLPLTP